MSNPHPRYPNPTGEPIASLGDYALDDWDGDGARAVSHKDILLARTLLGRLRTSQPEIAAGSDGSICMEWIRQVRSGERKIYVDIGPRGKILTFAKFEDSPPVEKHFDEYSPEADSHLQALFNRYSS